MVNKISVVNGTSLILLMVMLLRVGISYLMDVPFTMMLIMMVMVKVCCMDFKSLMARRIHWTMVREQF